MTVTKKKGRATVAVSPRNRLALWTLAAGRCQYTGCNELLLGDVISGKESLNKAFVAHIIAAAPDGPRGHPVLSHQRANDLENLMLLCHPHHELVDDLDETGHPVERLQAMKRAHEARIAMVGGIDGDRRTHILQFAARIGAHDCLVADRLSKAAVLPDRYPAEAPISLELIGSAFKDSEPAFWSMQADNLRRQFELKMGERLRAGHAHHVSVFAVAPQPLLIELGRLLRDIAHVDVFQLRRAPRGWAWRDDGTPIEFRRRQPGTAAGPRVALNLGVSARIDDSRIRAVLGEDCPIWAIEAVAPDNDILRRRSCLAGFRTLLRQTYADIKQAHGQDAEIHIFPALPVAMAVEVGRVWMPKADLPLILYDEDHALGGFQHRLEIGTRLRAAA